MSVMSENFCWQRKVEDLSPTKWPIPHRMGKCSLKRSQFQASQCNVLAGPLSRLDHCLGLSSVQAGALSTTRDVSRSRPCRTYPALDPHAYMPKPRNISAASRTHPESVSDVPHTRSLRTENVTITRKGRVCSASRICPLHFWDVSQLCPIHIQDLFQTCRVPGRILHVSGSRTRPRRDTYTYGINHHKKSSITFVLNYIPKIETETQHPKKS